jgi:hypothetical protein
MRKPILGKLLVATAACCLPACGGGGGGGSGIASTPTPPPPPPPPSTASVTIFANPTPGSYTSVGVSSASSLVHSDDRLTTLSSADSDQVHIRYNAGGYYEIEMPGAAWDRLVHYKGLVNPTADNNYFQPASVPQNKGYLITSISRDKGYSYSEMGAWGTDLTALAPFGYVAFGSATPAGAVPITGSASYSGIIAGTADIMQPDYLYGGYFPDGVGGSVHLNFDFAAGTLGGSMFLQVNGGMNPIDVGTFAFINTVFSAGSPTYSGKFDSAVSGTNYFLGRFTGPTAQETIGAWALPFVFSGDGQTHQAMGAWIAKKP